MVFRAIKYWPEIQTLLTILDPVIREWRKVAPQAVPLLFHLVREIAPELLQTEPGVLLKFDTYWLQESLNELGEHLTVDGQYGDATRDAVRRFQKANKIVVDGHAGIETLSAIYNKTRPVKL